VRYRAKAFTQFPIKNIARAAVIWLYQGVFDPGERVISRSVAIRRLRYIAAGTGMKRSRMHIFYSGHVQGVGFRYTVKSVAAGFEIVGTVRNLIDGRVELVGEGPREELEAFRNAIREAGLEHFIRNEEISWGEAAGEFRGFEIVR
jgi:acylphosphatase